MKNRREDQVEQAGTAARPGQTVTSAITAAQGLDRTSGVLVAQVASGGPAATAGLRACDIITAISSTTVTDQGALQEALLTTHASGRTVTIQISRSGAMRTLTVTPGQFSHHQHRMTRPARKRRRGRRVLDHETATWPGQQPPPVRDIFDNLD